MSPRPVSVHWTATFPRGCPCIILSLALSPSFAEHRQTPLQRPMPAAPSPFNRLASIQRHLTMNAQELKHFLADSPPTTVNLEIKKHFDALTDQQARYAHYISRYAHPYPQYLCDFVREIDSRMCLMYWNNRGPNVFGDFQY